MALWKRGTSAGNGTKLLAVCLAVVTALSMVVAPVGLAAGSTDGGDVDHSAASSLETSAESTGTVSTAAVQPSNFSSSTFLSGVNQPMGMTFLPDGRMLLLEKPGTIEITDPGDGTKDTSTYLDITGKVNDGSERGLIDIALDPNFEQNGYVYVFYSNDAEDTNRIARFTHQENGGGLQSTADASSEFVVWKEDEQWQSCCHQGAGLDFGPDGKLWLTTGDDFQGGAVSQDLSRASGKVIRVNKDGTIPQDNPYVDDGDPNTLGEIWAYGVRNPFRAEWDLQSGRFFFGDVGGNSAPDYEEVNVATLDNPAANYGWPDCEGTSKSNEDAPCDVSQTAPVYSYPHSEGNSITGGEVYRGQQFPDEYQGAYFFGDYAKDWIKYLTFDSNGDVQSVEMFEDSANNVNAISVGPDGSLYWTSISDGTIHEVTYTGNQAPSIDSVSATPTSAASAPQTVDFSVSASDPDQDSLTYNWTFGDGSTASGASPSHTYQSAGTYTAYVEVSDGTQTVESQPIEITIGEPPSVTIDSPADGSLFQAGDTIEFNASGTDPQDGTLSSDAFTWDVVFDHDPPEGAAHTHPVLSDYTGESGSFDVPASGHGYSTDTSYTLTVTATDSDGLSASDSVTIEPDKVDITFATDPGGLELSVDGLPVNDGAVIDTLVGFEHEVSAPTTQCLNGREYEFQGWSDGGAQTHTYTVPTSDATLTANYQDVGECSAPVTDGLVAQFEADQGVTTSGGQVTGWADQSGQGNDLAAVGDPTTATAPSGQPVISLDGDGDKLERTDALSGLPSGSQNRTMFVVTEYQNANEWAGAAFGAANPNEAFGLIVQEDSGLLDVTGYFTDITSDTQGTGAGWLVQSATVADDQVTHYKNGTQIDNGTHTYETDPDDAQAKFIVGEEISGAGYNDMEVAAVLVYDRALSDSERQQVEAYFQQKYLSQEATNQNPTAVDDSASVTAGSSTTIDVLANDDDPDGSLDASTVTIDQGPAHGTATVNPDGSITYAHDGSDTTSDTFVYQVSDDQGAGDAATVTVSIDQGTDTGGSSLPVTSGLVTHYAADQGVSVGTGDVVTGWADQSGQGNDLTATGDPLVKHDTLAGNQVISFDGDGDALVRTAALNGLPSGNDDRTIIYVVDYQSSPDWGGGVAYGATVCNDAFGLIVHDSSLQVQGWCEDFTAPASAEVGSGDWLTHSAVLSGDQVTHYKNGTQIDQFTHTYDTDPQKIVVGAELDEDPYVDMEVAEVVVYDRALTDTERQQVETYFEQTYFTANAAPTASDDSGSVTAGQSTTIDVLANDTDSDGSLNASSVQVTSGPATGTATANPDGNITYSAPSGASGDVTFGYTVDDDDGATSNEATVTVSISADTGTGTYGTSTGQATNVVIDTSTATNASATLDGTLTLGDKQEATPYVKIWPEGQPEDAFWYTGAPTTQSGGFQFDVVLSPSTTYVWQTLAQSGDGAWKAGEEKTFTTPTGQYFGVDSTGASDVGVESATLNGEIVNLGDNADAQVYFTYWKQGQKDSTLTWYTGPVQDSPGAFSTEVGLEPGTTYEYRAFGQSNEGEWKAGPAETFTTQSGQPYGVATESATNVDADSATLQGNLTGLGDRDNATVYFQYWKQGQKGSTLTWWTGSSLSSPGQFGADVTGLDSETTYVFQAYAESDDGKWTAGSEETFTTDATGAVNQPPTASDDAATVTAGESTTIDVLANDTDSDGSLNASSVSIASGPSNGTVSVNPDGTISYSAPSGASGDVTFTYTVADDDGATDTATVTVTVTQPPDSSLPVTSGLVTHLEAGQGVTTSGDNVTGWADQSGQGNDLTASGDPTLVTDGPNGQPVISLDGDGDKLERTDALSGLPSGSQNRTMFVVTEYQNANEWAGAAFGAANPNEAFGLIVQEDSGLLDVTGYFTDITSATQGTGAGWLVQSATVADDQVTHYKNGTQIDSGTHTYETDPDDAQAKFIVGEEISGAGYNDMEVAAVLVYDRALSDSERQQVEAYFQQKYLDTTGTSNVAPTASDDAASVTAGQSTTIDVLANDTDSDGSLNASSVQVTSGPATGTATANPDGTITYDTPSGASGDATFTYTVDDDDGATSNEATVTVSISAANTAPTASDDSATVDAGQSVVVDVLANDTDSDGSLNASSVQVTSGPSNGTVSVDDSTGAITYTHGGSDSASDSFTYSVADDDGATDTATVSITVNQPTTSSLPVTSGLVTHFDAGQGVTTSGDNVTGWADQSGQGNDLTASGDPTLVTDGPNGEPMVSLDGTDDLLQRTDTLTGLPSGNDSRTIMYVVNYQSSPDWGGGVAYGAAACNNAFGLIVHDSSLQVQGWCEDFTAPASADVGSDTWLTQSAVLASDQVTHYKNGTQIDQFTHTYDTDPQKIVVGAELDGSPLVDMEVAEVVVYDRALTDTERQQVEQYLQDKYGIGA
ncbi:Ig-like domain-containing protein [Natronomonas marina]|uniref:Ig-like domain-containing protein n=1 Tax=Natronomonas marina TaxID=2961939 RepID=UPI0020C97ADC|nr:Ig-like domain-containing protein [Natronomonas marina]